MDFDKTKQGKTNSNFINYKTSLVNNITVINGTFLFNIKLASLLNRPQKPIKVVGLSVALLISFFVWSSGIPISPTVWARNYSKI